MTSQYEAESLMRPGSIRANSGSDAMVDETVSQDHRVDCSHDGKFRAFWRGRVVFANGRVKRFETEQEAWEFLARCDALGKIEH